MLASKKTFFLRNFRQIFRVFRNFGDFLEFSALLLLLLLMRTLVHGFLEFSGNFLNFQRIFGEKRQNKSLALRISRYSILEVRYDIFFDTLKVSIYRHSIISRFDKSIPGPERYLCRHQARYSKSLIQLLQYYPLNCPSSHTLQKLRQSEFHLVASHIGILIYQFFNGIHLLLSIGRSSS